VPASKELFSAPQEERVFAFSPPAEAVSIDILADGDEALLMLHDFRSSCISDNPRIVAQTAEMVGYRGLPDSNHSDFAATCKPHHDVPACATVPRVGFQLTHVQTAKPPMHAELSVSSDAPDSYLHTSGNSAIAHIYYFPVPSASNINQERWTARFATSHKPTLSEEPVVYATPGPTFACSRSSFESPIKDTLSPGMAAFDCTLLHCEPFNTRGPIIRKCEDSTIPRQGPSLVSLEEYPLSSVFDPQSPVSSAPRYCDNCSVSSKGFGPRYQRGLDVNAYLAGGHAQVIEHSDFCLTLDNFISVLHHPSSTPDESRCVMNSCRGYTFGTHTEVRAESAISSFADLKFPEESA